MGILDKINNIASENGLDLQSMVDKTQSKISGVSQQFVGKVQSKPEPNEHVEAPFEQPSSKPAFCSNCGTKLNDGAKFCHGCGASVGVTQAPTPPIPQNNVPERKQEYAGTVMKCPNCGSVISSIDAICAMCGMQITGKGASNTVKEFSATLMEIEKLKVVENKGGLFAKVGYEERVRNAYATYYSQKLTLIKTFPIPNTVEEIYEFMFLATTNIDVKVSKNTLWSKFDNSGSSAKEISDAWVQKMKQAYQKATISFPNDPVFQHIQRIYVAKMKELKM